MIIGFGRLLALLALLAVTAVSAGAQSSGTPNLVNFVYGNFGPNASEIPFYIAQQQGFFRDEGLQVSVVAFTGPQDVLNAVASGAVNMVAEQSETSVSAIAHEIDVKMVAPYYKIVAFRLVTLPTVTSWQQLRTATVSLGSKIGADVTAYHRLLRAHGVSDTDIVVVTAGNTNARLAALLSGNVQATWLNQPTDFIAEQKGMKVMAEAADVMQKDWIWSELIVSNTWARANRATLVHYLRAFRKAILFGYSHRDATVSLLESNLKIDHDTAEKTYDLTWVKWKGFDPDLRIDPHSLETVANTLVGYGAISQAPSVDQMYDPSYAAAARR